MVGEVKVRQMPTKNAVHGRCEGCGHEWVIVYLPMELGKAARVMKRACCPACGASSKSIVVADPK